MIDPHIEVARIVSQTEDAQDTDRAQAFARLIARPALDQAYRYATLVLGSRSDAEDATHDAALTAWRRFGDLRDRDRFDAWFGRILVNACRDRLRARRRTPLSLDAEPPTATVANLPAALIAPDRTETFAVHETLATALRSLTPDHREVIALRFYLDLTIDQIAARTGARPGTVKSRLHHALRHLRTAIDPAREGSFNR